MKEYIKPETEIVMAATDVIMVELSTAVNGQGLNGGPSTPIEEGNPDDIFGKDGSNLWDGWDD